LHASRLTEHLHLMTSKFSAAIAIERGADDDYDAPPAKSKTSKEFKDARILSLHLTQVAVGVASFGDSQLNFLLTNTFNLG
jgi:hypothetical protein